MFVAIKLYLIVGLALSAIALTTDDAKVTIQKQPNLASLTLLMFLTITLWPVAIVMAFRSQ